MIEWRCAVCEAPVADGEGYLHVSFAAIDAREAALAERDREHPRGLRVYTLAALLNGPKPVPWEVHHARCDPRSRSNDYAIEIERIRTTVDLLEWCAHLLEKVWLSETDWPALLWRVLRGLKAAA